jgi:hypothetical protein
MGKNNRLNHEQAYKLNCWVAENHNKYEHMLQDEISEQASKELGFTVKTSNALSSYTTLKIPFGRQSRAITSKATKEGPNDYIFASAIRQLFLDAGKQAPVEILRIFLKGHTS